MLKKYTFIYTLIDPITNEVRYIGKSNNPSFRLYKHIYESKIDTKTHKKAWIKSLLVHNLVPLICVIDKVPVRDWQIYEIYYISLYKECGCDLVNTTGGGENPPILYGDLNPMKNKDIVQKCRVANTGKFRTDESKQRMRETHLRIGSKPPSRKGTSFKCKTKKLGTRMKRIIAFNIDNTIYKEFNSIKEALEHFNWSNTQYDKISREIKNNNLVFNKYWKIINQTQIYSDVGNTK